MTTASTFEGTQAPFPALFRDEVFQIETPRLWLRWPALADVSDVCAYASDKRVSAMTAQIPHPYRREHAETYVREARALNAEGRGFVVSVQEKASRRVIGGHSIRLREATPTLGAVPTLGYALHPDYWGRGYASEAARALVKAFFRFTDGDLIWAGALPENPASQKVLYKTGFRHVGQGVSARPANGDTVRVERFELTRGQWLMHNGFRADVPWGVIQGRRAA